MAPKHKRPTKATSNKTHPVEHVIEETILKHADGARTRKEQRERIRLAPRARVTRAVYDAVEKEFAMRERNGTRPSPERVAQICEDHVKQLLRQLAIEHAPEKDV